MSEATAEEARAGHRHRPWWRPGPRAIVEAAVLVASAVGLGVMKERGEFPRPMIRALRSGTAAEKAEALRGLSLFGRAGEEAVPALLEALRDDPSPSVRRGSAFVLAAIVAAPESVEPFSLEQLLAGDEGRALDATAEGPIPRPHPMVGRAAAGLMRSLREDPDPTVRGEAIAALGPLLDAALGLRPPAEQAFGAMRQFEGPPAPPHSAFPVDPWMRDAAGAIADRAGSADAPESRQATAWIYAAPAAQLLLDDGRRADALVRGGIRAAQGVEHYLDALLVSAAALSVRDDPDRRGAFLDGMARAMARPRPASPPAPANGPPIGPTWDRGGVPIQPLDPDEHAIPFWMAGPSAREVAEHPGANDATIRLLALGPRARPVYTSSGGWGRMPPIVDEVQALNVAARNRAGPSRFSTPGPGGLLLQAILDDPAIADLLADRLGAEHWRQLFDTMGNWDDLMATWLDPTRSPGLPPDRAEAAAGVLLDVVAGIPEDQATPRHRALAALAYVVRGTADGSEARRRFRALAERLGNAPGAEGRAMGRRLREGIEEGGEASP